MFDKNVAMPPRKDRKKYFFETMDVGDSKEYGKNRNAIASAAVNAGVKYDMQFSTRRMPNGNIRVWRTS